MSTTDSMQHQTNSAPVPHNGVIARTTEQVRQFFCGLHGHDALLHFDHGRLSLLCTSCGYESPGWDTTPEPEQHEAPTPTQHDAVTRTPRVLRMPTLGERHAA